jgi:hypothetical protein
MERKVEEFQISILDRRNDREITLTQIKALECLDHKVLSKGNIDGSITGTLLSGILP